MVLHNPVFNHTFRGHEILTGLHSTINLRQPGIQRRTWTLDSIGYPSFLTYIPYFLGCGERARYAGTL
ncbi:hypothetical protein AG1IA_09775 [Rhizoctonia solani AG-1 IA]|uniref:Uncharacterized protein n=1 Tax=Thanatephorus cucumeris (strain AG1-IA) TaxID=983506 RepID=L8WIM0_THACA|nr:hypothetical protein AG1IA_09775 [Rhizoctonia solani AG-1 IA]